MSNARLFHVRKAWKILRQWKLHSCRRPFPVDFRPLRRFIKRIVHPTPTPLPPHYAERQFSFNDTPIFHLKFHRRRPPSASAALFLIPRFSCINPEVEFERYDDCECERRRFGGACDYEEEEVEEEEEEDGIDLKAEKFIKMFYEEMRMQSEVSYLRFDEFSDGDGDGDGDLLN